MKISCLTTLTSGLLALDNAAAADQVLFDFTRDSAPTHFEVSDAQTTNTSSGLRVTTWHRQSWPGVTLPAPAGHWDLSPYADVALQLRNLGADAVTIDCRVDNPGADGVHNCLTHSVQLAPGQSGTLKIPLRRFGDDTLSGKLFGMRGYPAGLGGPDTIDPKNITQLVVFVPKPKYDHLFEISEIRATGSLTLPTAFTSDADSFFPFIDTFGQYRHRDWPGKTKSLEDLAASRQREAQELAHQPGPADWDQYGGWAKGPKLKATGFFRAEKVKGKWWFVDPDGRLFFSHGIDCVGTRDSTPIEERDSWFADFPGRQPEFSAFLSKAYTLKGHYEGRTVECFSFAGANLARKYGPDWQNTYRRFLHQRLRSWGLNTIANWSDGGVCLLRRTPYTDSIGTGGARKIEGSSGYWGKFLDPFDPALPGLLRREMEQKKTKSAGDPWCLGYFSDNEMSWGDDLSLSVSALQSPPGQPAKQAFLADLKSRYGDITKLNQAWGTGHASWDALLQAREAPGADKARPDLAAFYSRLAEQYFRTVREAIRSVAPNQLYLGCRFAWVNDRAAAAAAKYCDVVSYNLYQRGVANFKFNGGREVPLLIGEFHFGALDRGLFHPGLVPTDNQPARAQAYKDYVLGALRHPQFVGCHWFEYMDEPTTGRVYDEENYQIGFVDVADTPYCETIAACREVGYKLYDQVPQ
jgi:hypothetical protein